MDVSGGKGREMKRKGNRKRKEHEKKRKKQARSNAKDVPEMFDLNPNPAVVPWPAAPLNKPSP